MGTQTEFVINGEDIKGVSFGDGLEEKARAFGLFGGLAGGRNELRFEYPDGETYQPKAKEVLHSIPTGTRYFQRAGGGGGYGDPKAPPVAAVLDDVRNELISVERARSDYGVAVDPDTLEVDVGETETLRAKNG